MDGLEKERRRANQKNYRARNREKVKARGKKYREKNQDKLKENNRNYYGKNRCELLLAKKTYVSENKTKVSTCKRAAQEKMKREVFLAYGGTNPECRCCGENDNNSLCIDHEDGGGNAHRRSIGRLAGYSFYVWLKKNGFPKGFRILCLNCNAALGMFKYCPHAGRPIKALSRMSRYLRGVKLTVMSAYSGGSPKCKECGIEEIEFLSLDHNGVQHVREDGGSSWKTYKWAIDNGFPDGFQVLCFRCNFLKWKRTKKAA